MDDAEGGLSGFYDHPKPRVIGLWPGRASGFTVYLGCSSITATETFSHIPACASFFFFFLFSCYSFFFSCYSFFFFCLHLSIIMIYYDHSSFFSLSLFFFLLSVFSCVFSPWWSEEDFQEKTEFFTCLPPSDSRKCCGGKVHSCYDNHDGGMACNDHSKAFPSFNPDALS